MLVFDAAGQPPPQWNQSTYPGYPHVLAGSARTVVVAIAYCGVPGCLLALGLFVTRRRKRQP
jgi:hypothetical protein